ncbi:MAG: amidohydrolase family protein, partial [Synergistaceae bacterium]|nr:amidohydrolase family protein [Synergistaceae bacterium]
PNKDEIKFFPNAYVICRLDTCQGVYMTLPDELINIPVIDFGDSLIVPGMTDLHIHAPQYSFRGMGMDCELLDWLNKYAFTEEAKYADTDYAARAYGIFADSMKRSATTRAVIFGTVHREATLILMDLMESAGIVSYVGKVNMDRNAPDDLRESSAVETLKFIRDSAQRKYHLTMPIITPRFIPGCSNSLLDELSERLDAKGLRISVADDVKARILEKGYKPKYGARPLRRAIQSMLEDKLSDFMLSGNLPEGDSTISVSLKGEELTCELV